MLRFKIDRQLILLAIAPTPFWLILQLRGTMTGAHAFLPFISMAVIYPLVEETFFRGILQPQIAKRYSSRAFNLLLANIAISALFTISHLLNHEPLWALATFIPSLTFGYCLERYRTLQAPLALHCYYNAGYFMVAGA